MPRGSVLKSFNTRSRNRVSDHEGRGREEIGADVRVDARLEVAVAREHRGADQLVLDDGLLDRLRERARVADAGGAAVAGEVEAELLQVGQQARLGQVLGDHARAGRERGLDVRLHRQAELDRLLRQQACREQHAGVGGVGAGGDRRDQHVAVADVDAVVGLVRLVQIGRILGETIFLHRRGEQAREGALHLVQVDAVLRALRAGERRHHRRQVELQVLAVVDRARLRHAEHLLRLVVGLEGGDLGVRAARCP